MMLAGETVCISAHPSRPPRRWVDIFKAPLHDFPIRAGRRTKTGIGR